MTQIIVLCLAALILVISASLEDPLVVSTPAGTFRGTALLSLQGHIYLAFVGMPYALPPVGDLRFAKPVRYPKIEHIYNATEFAPVCIQPTGIDLGGPAREDCLYLNVFVPEEDDQEPKDDKLKKVFLYVHGGGFFMGSSLEYLPGDLVALSDVIVVTFNYRLSWLGFLKGSTSELPGNQGMWDQLLALKWVRDNIRSFGGDPDDITIGGNSMGGESVSALSITPHAKGLFTKGLIMSGTMFTCPSTPGSSDILLDLLTERVGCKHETTDATVNCLRQLPPEKFVLPIEGRITNKFTTIDGDFFPAPIESLIKDKDYLENVGFFSRDYIVSLMNNEGAVDFFGPFDVDVDPDTMSAAFLSQAFKFPMSVAEKILSWYKIPGHFRFKPSYDILADYTMTLPTYRFLEASASDNRGGHQGTGRSYFLYFDYLPSYSPSAVQGMGHGFDLMYLFDIQPDQMLQYYYYMHADEEFSQQDFQLKKLYIDILAGFMKSGYPDTALSEKLNFQWPAFNLTSEGYLSFGPEPSVKQFPLKDRIQFWEKLFPEYLNEHLKSHHDKQEL